MNRTKALTRVAAAVAVLAAATLGVVAVASIGFADAAGTDPGTTDAAGSTPLAAGAGPGAADDRGTAVPDRPGTNLTKLAAFLDLFEVSDDERTAILDRAETMEENGAPAKAVRRMVAGRLRSAGHERGEVRARHRQFRLTERFDVTAAQAGEIVTEAREMRADGASRAEIRRAVADELDEFGVPAEEVEEARIDHRVSRLRCVLNVRTDLSDEGIDEVAGRARGMLSEGATIAEVRGMVREYLREHGATVEPPGGEHDRDHDHDEGHGVDGDGDHGDDGDDHDHGADHGDDGDGDGKESADESAGVGPAIPAP